MGYRSDVTALVYPADTADATEESARLKYEALKLRMPSTFPQVVEEFGACMEWLDADGLLVFTMSSVKWYPDHGGVQVFEAMLEQLAELGYAHEFGRVGDDDDDNEIQRSDGNRCLLSISRALTVDRKPC